MGREWVLHGQGHYVTSSREEHQHQHFNKAGVGQAWHQCLARGQPFVRNEPRTMCQSCGTQN